MHAAKELLNFRWSRIHFKFTAEEDRVYTCFYDLASAVDSVEFSVLLEQLYHVGVRGKCWRIIKDWYTDLSDRSSPTISQVERFGPQH